MTPSAAAPGARCAARRSRRNRSLGNQPRERLCRGNSPTSLLFWSPCAQVLGRHRPGPVRPGDGERCRLLGRAPRPGALLQRWRGSPHPTPVSGARHALLSCPGSPAAPGQGQSCSDGARRGLARSLRHMQHRTAFVGPRGSRVLRGRGYLAPARPQASSTAPREPARSAQYRGPAGREPGLQSRVRGKGCPVAAGARDVRGRELLPAGAGPRRETPNEGPHLRLPAERPRFSGCFYRVDSSRLHAASSSMMPPDRRLAGTGLLEPAWLRGQRFGCAAWPALAVPGGGARWPRGIVLPRGQFGAGKSTARFNFQPRPCCPLHFDASSASFSSPGAGR